MRALGAGVVPVPEAERGWPRTQPAAWAPAARTPASGGRSAVDGARPGTAKSEAGGERVELQRQPQAQGALGEGGVETGHLPELSDGLLIEIRLNDVLHTSSGEAEQTTDRRAVQTEQRYLFTVPSLPPTL